MQTAQRRNRQPIQVGQIVALVSGGPLMRVQSERRDAVRCVWFEHGNKFFGYFRPDLLVRIEG